MTRSPQDVPHQLPTHERTKVCSTSPNPSLLSPFENIKVVCVKGDANCCSCRGVWDDCCALYWLRGTRLSLRRRWESCCFEFFTSAWLCLPPCDAYMSMLGLRWAPCC